MENILAVIHVGQVLECVCAGAAIFVRTRLITTLKGQFEGLDLVLGVKVGVYIRFRPGSGSWVGVKISRMNRIMSTNVLTSIERPTWMSFKPSSSGRRPHSLKHL